MRMRMVKQRRGKYRVTRIREEREGEMKGGGIFHLFRIFFHIHSIPTKQNKIK